MGNFYSSVQNILYSVICRRSKWVTSYFILLFRKRNSRMYKYDMKVDGKPFKTGFFIPSQEWDLECPSENQDTNEMFCFGTNSNGDCLAMLIDRECACDSSSLFLKVNGYTYTLPVKLNYLTTQNKKIFGNNRFYMQCLAPFRKWKLFFNGMLREMDPDKDHDRIVHVRFSFVWTASSGVFDFTSNYSPCNIADILCETEWGSLTPPIDRILSILNEYHQPGMFLGTIHIGNQCQQEVLLWGFRRHSFGMKYKDPENHLDLFGNAENGFLFYFKIMSLTTILKKNISGYIMQPNGSLIAVHFLSLRRIRRYKKTILLFRIKAGDQHYNISAFFYEYGHFFGKRIHDNMTLTVIDFIANGIWGGGLAIERIYSKSNIIKMKCRQISSLLKSMGELSLEPLVLTLEDPLCLNKCLTGNFGSSLANLLLMKDQISGYDVSAGLVLTTTGYGVYFSAFEGSILQLKKNILKYDEDELMSLCDRIVQEASNFYFPPEIYDSLCEKLNEILGDSEGVSFCIYPSITGSETEVQLLEPYLHMFSNVIGLFDVISCIKKCWASQFSFGAIECKRSTGQLLNIPMAVIVQKSVSFKTSGVISTCNSLSGDPSVVEIREKIDKVLPGTIHFIILKRDLRNNLKIFDANVVYKHGSSKTCDIEVDNPFDNENCLSEEQSISLGVLACKLEKYFLFPQCFEWCLDKNKFFLIQVRAIILTNAETKLEVHHYWDTYIRTEDEWLSSFNTGEAFVGAISPLGMELLNFCIEIFIAKMKWVNSELWNNSQVPYFPKFLVYSHNHMMYCLADGIFRFQSKCKSFFFKTLSFMLNFKSGSEEELLDLIFGRYGNSCLSFKVICYSLLVLLFSGKKSKALEGKMSIYDLNLEKVDSAIDVLNILSCHYQELTQSFVCYMNCTYSAIFWSMFVFYILGKCRADRNQLNNIQNDFNCLMSALSVSEEGDLILDILALSNRIAKNINPALFKEMPSEIAQLWLEDAEIDRKVQFSDFMKKHGHRSYKEVDIFQKCWSMDSIYVVHVLQNIVSSSPLNSVPATFSLNHVFNQLPVMPNFFQKLILKYAVPKCVKSLREVKRAKSNLLKVASFWRKAFHHLANNAVKEFRIPFPEALFFLSLEEIRHLLQTESPHLVTKALKCWEMHADIDKYVFPVITIGFPSPLSENYFTKERLKVGSYLKGTPLSRGTAVGIAVVVTKFDEVTFIERGSILITRTPSIAWSLYFPILGGFAADLGGLLSDGAIAAREYGLPCVINLVRASLVLKTGDRVFIDGNTGVLRRKSSN